MGKYWSESEKETLRLLYGKKSIKEISEIMGRSEKSILIQSLKAGLRESENKSWTIEEDDLLKKLWGKVPIEVIMKKLGRSKSSIKSRATFKNLGWARDVNEEELSLSVVSKMLNVRIKNIKTTWQKRGLKLKTKKVSENKKYYYVDFYKLLVFLEKNQDLWNSVYLEIYAFGEEPEWLLEKRKRDVDPLILNQGKKWTPWEIAILRDLLLHHYSYEDIGKQLNRTPLAIREKAWEIGMGYKVSKFWTPEEKKLVIENYSFMPNKDLSKLIPGRSIGAIERQAEIARVLKRPCKNKLEKE